MSIVAGTVLPGTTWLSGVRGRVAAVLVLLFVAAATISPSKTA